MIFILKKHRQGHISIVANNVIVTFNLKNWANSLDTRDDSIASSSGLPLEIPARNQNKSTELQSSMTIHFAKDGVIAFSLNTNQKEIAVQARWKENNIDKRASLFFSFSLKKKV